MIEQTQRLGEQPGLFLWAITIRVFSKTIDVIKTGMNKICETILIRDVTIPGAAEISKILTKPSNSLPS